MPEFDQHSLFLSCSRVGAQGPAGKEQARQILRRRLKERVRHALVYSAFTTAAGKKTSTLRAWY
jgi:hypothetical protein